MNDIEFSKYIATLSTKSMLYELATSPKPGLVDRYNSGAHDDMDFFTFLNSSSVLFPYFYDCTMAGIDFKEEDYTYLLRNIRPIGIKAEEDMFQATYGINTHKGLIFSLGILGAAVGSIFKENISIRFKSTDISNRVKLISKGITGELENLEYKNDLTYGEKLYLKYGVTGIRGEAESGFFTVRNYSLPILKDLVGKNKFHINDILVHTLMHLIANTKDSNILGRHDLDTLKYAQSKAKTAIKLGGFLRPKGRSFIKEMDKEFIEKNISPGGAADLLAVTLMFSYLEGSKLEI